MRDGPAGALAREPDIDVVATTGDGTDALALAGPYTPDVLIADIRLVRRSGLEVAAEATGPAWPAPCPCLSAPETGRSWRCWRRLRGDRAGR
ncbi:hypothetical protein [Streptomyces canus]|uniref:hypothetical protein n=1 Tax=Streptomyces canus TaxID=58343 RepID=UPI0027D82151|nr:hypothetical protein [Streptomyces canus]